MAAKMRNTTMKKPLAAVALLAASLALPCRPSFASTVSVAAGDDAVWQGVENAVDLDGNPRIFRKIVDLGCYECQTAARTVLLVL